MLSAPTSPSETGRTANPYPASAAANPNPAINRPFREEKTMTTSIVREEITDCAAIGVHPWALRLHLSRRALYQYQQASYEMIMDAYNTGRERLLKLNPEAIEYGDWMRPEYR
jgi:hypothetical protein